MRRYRFVFVLILLIALLAAGYSAAGLLVFTRAASAVPACGQPGLAAYRDNRPDAYQTTGSYDIPELDTAAYHISSYETVTFPSREDSQPISAWYAPADTPDAPAVILAHGLNGCRRVPDVLLPAGMLHRAGFQVLLIDLRNHGDSAITTGRMAGGILEYRDVLGAWDWLVTARGVPPERIGLLGNSLGAATVLIAAGNEPRVAAVWADSSYANVEQAVLNELDRIDYPALLAPAGMFMGRLIDGIDFGGLTPEKAVAALNGRPVFITHGAADTRMPVQHADMLAVAAQAETGAAAEVWIVPDSEHIRAMYTATADYERHLLDFFSAHLKP